MSVYVVTYCYPNGQLAGVVGVYKTQAAADDAISSMKSDYSDCTFCTFVSELE